MTFFVSQLKVLKTLGGLLVKILNRFIIKTKRAGLSESMDKIEFRDEPLRYIALFSAKENFNYKTKGLDSLIGEKYKEGAITKEKAIEVLGYAKKL